MSAWVAVAGKLPPLTASEIGLMLRSGYSLSDVENEVRGRHFMGSIDPAAEKALTASGASPAFIENLRSGPYAVPQGKKEADRSLLFRQLVLLLPQAHPDLARIL